MPVMVELDFEIRDEQFGDQREVWQVNEAAFGHSDEADLVDRLRDEGVVLLSLVAELHGQIVGHICSAACPSKPRRERCRLFRLLPWLYSGAISGGRLAVIWSGMVWIGCARVGSGL